jgi:amidase
VALADPADVDLRGLRVAMHARTEAAVADEATAAVVGQAAAALREAGAVVAEAAPPAGGHALTIDVWRSYGGDLRSDALYRLLRRWDAFRTEMLAFAARFDVLLGPVFPGPARAHGAMNVPGEIDPTGFTTPYSLTGWPAATVRCGTSREGLPIGVQVVAGPWRDDVALAAAQRLEDELGGWRPPPL